MVCAKQKTNISKNKNNLAFDFFVKILILTQNMT